jgi:deazaflavin-dependent oxidoreductase (nitroreductase family)
MAKTYQVTMATRAVMWVTRILSRLGVGNFVVLTVTGRRSGRPRSVMVAPISRDGNDYLVSPYGEVSWVHNVRAEPLVTLGKRGSERVVRLDEVTGRRPGIVKDYYDRESFARQYMDVPGAAAIDDFASVPARFPVFRIEERG